MFRFLPLLEIFMFALNEERLVGVALKRKRYRRERSWVRLLDRSNRTQCRSSKALRRFFGAVLLHRGDGSRYSLHASALHREYYQDLIFHIQSNFCCIIFLMHVTSICSSEFNTRVQN